MKKIVSLVLVLALVCALGFSAMAAEGLIIDSAYVDESKLLVEALDNPENKEVRIAALCVTYAPFWVEVVSGMETAKAYLKDKNCTVDIIALEDLDAKLFSDAIETCVVKGYDGISTFGVSDALVPAIEDATAAGVNVYIYNCNTAKENSAVCFVGQELREAGQFLGEKLVEYMGEEGTVGIITGLFSANAHELRRMGAVDSISKYPGIKLLEAVECNDNDTTAYDVATDLITGNPDLTGILCTANGQIGTARAIKDLGKQDEITLVAFDYMTEILDFIDEGIIKCSVGQGPFTQGASPIIYAYNDAITGTNNVTGNVWTDMDLITKDNTADYR